MEGLVLRLSNDGTKVQAICTPAESTSPPDESSLRKLIEGEGFSQLYLLNQSLAELVNRFAAGNPFTIDVAERRDGTFSVTVLPDLMKATLTLTPPYGGAAVTAEEVLQHLQQEGITTGIQHDAIKAATMACRALNKPIALGEPATPGEAAQFVSLIPEIKERCPHPDDDTCIVDYRDLGGIVSVRPGDPLMRRIPPTEGTAGIDIKGKPIPALRGKDGTFAPNLTGTAVSPDDADLLIAATAGQPVMVTNGVIVEPTVKVKSIDLSSGNITFEGTLVVSGDVASGMVVKASGDITIGGTVEAAMLEAGGNVDVKGGLIFAQVHAQGSISALFSEKAHLHAGRSIFLRELAMQSDLKAGAEIVVGEKGMKKGHIIGGLCRAATCVRAIVIGSHAGVPTRIEVGVDPDAREKLALVRQHIEEKQKEADETDKTLAYMHDNSTRVSPESLKQREQIKTLIETEIAELNRQKTRLQKRLETVDSARIEVEKNIYYGVQIVVGEKVLTVDDDLEAVTFRMEDGVIVN